MNTAKIRQHLHNYLEVADDKKIKALYVMMENEIAENVVVYDEALKTELNQLEESYHDGSAKLYSAVESKKRIKEILGKNS